jgi:hypothetical protein
VPHFQLVTTDGETLGPIELGHHYGPDGSIIYTGSGKPNLRVVGRVEADDDDPELFDVLIVEEVQSGHSASLR